MYVIITFSQAEGQTLKCEKFLTMAQSTVEFWEWMIKKQGKNRFDWKFKVFESVCEFKNVSNMKVVENEITLFWIRLF